MFLQETTRHGFHSRSLVHLHSKYFSAACRPQSACCSLQMNAFLVLNVSYMQVCDSLVSPATGVTLSHELVTLDWQTIFFL